VTSSLALHLGSCGNDSPLRVIDWPFMHPVQTTVPPMRAHAADHLIMRSLLFMSSRPCEVSGEAKARKLLVYAQIGGLKRGVAGARGP
jgi:hypothetical protein